MARLIECDKCYKKTKEDTNKEPTLMLNKGDDEFITYDFCPDCKKEVVKVLNCFIREVD